MTFATKEDEEAWKRGKRHTVPMTSDLHKKARWANEAIAPASSMLHQAGRALVDLPSDVTPGAGQIAQLTAWCAVQQQAIGQIVAALDELSNLPDWSGGFLVADSVNFDWRTAPFKHYDSFAEFCREELEPTMQALEQLQATYRRLAK